MTQVWRTAIWLLMTLLNRLSWLGQLEVSGPGSTYLPPLHDSLRLLLLCLLRPWRLLGLLSRLLLGQLDLAPRGLPLLVLRARMLRLLRSRPWHGWLRGLRLLLLLTMRLGRVQWVGLGLGRSLPLRPGGCCGLHRLGDCSSSLVTLTHCTIDPISMPALISEVLHCSWPVCTRPWQGDCCGR